MNALDLNATDGAIQALSEWSDVVEWLRAPAPPVTAIDSYVQVFVGGRQLAPQRRHTPDYDATLVAYVRLLAGNGISLAVLVQASFLGTDNSFFAATICRACPQRFRGVAVVDPAGSVQELESLANAAVVGIRLNFPGLPLPDLRSGHWPRLLARANNLQWHIEVQREASDLSCLRSVARWSSTTWQAERASRPVGSRLPASALDRCHGHGMGEVVSGLSKYVQQQRDGPRRGTRQLPAGRFRRRAPGMGERLATYLASTSHRLCRICPSTRHLGFRRIGPGHHSQTVSQEVVSLGLTHRDRKPYHCRPRKSS